MDINVFIDENLERCVETSWLQAIAEKILIALGAESTVELDLAIVGQERIRELNRTYLEEDEPTDVLAFSMLSEQREEETMCFVTPPDGVTHLGEVIISYPQAVIQAEEHQHPVEKEIAILIIHGVLHLLGYDHDKPEAEYQMRAREMEILSYIEGELF